MPNFRLELVAPDRVLFEGEVKSLVAPGSEGYLGVLARHAPLLARLTVGELKFTLPDGATRFAAVSGGFIEVSPRQATVLADSAELGEEIDVARAQAASEAARRILAEKPDREQVLAAEAALNRALNRLKVAGRVRRG